MILPLEKQVATRETCERLQEANFNGGTLLWWAPQQTPEVDWEWRVSTSPTGDVGIPAPTAAELGALLPNEVKCDGEWYFYEQTSLGCDCGYAGGGKNNMPWVALILGPHTEAEARALLWLDLHEKGLLPDAAYGASSH